MPKSLANKRMTILMTPAEKQQLIARAAYYNISLSAYIRLKLNEYFKR